jgi:hypothetical protein
MKQLATIATLMTLAVAPALAQETPASMVGAYESLADTILAVRGAEAGLVRAILDGHRHAAETLLKNGDHQGAAAQIALFANEGDNRVGGVRKRLLEGGHHFNAGGEKEGIFEPGYVIVDRTSKKALLDASAALRRAGDEAAKKQAYASFDAVAQKLLAKR